MMPQPNSDWGWGQVNLYIAEAITWPKLTLCFTISGCALGLLCETVSKVSLQTSSGKKIIFWNFISFNIFMQCSNETSNLWHYMWNLPVLRFWIIHYFHRFYIHMYVYIYFRLFTGLSFGPTNTDSNPIFATSAA